MTDKVIPSAWLAGRDWPEAPNMLVENVVEELLNTDAISDYEGHGLYTVHEDDLEYLVKTILDFAADWYAPHGEAEVVDE